MRIGLVGTGWITPIHLRALANLGRTQLVGVVSRTVARAAQVTATWGGDAFDDLERMLDEARPEAVFVCLPPHRTADSCIAVIERGIPLFVEKPLAAARADVERVAAALEGRGLVTAVGYQWRAIDLLPEVRRRLVDRPARLVLGRWTGETPGPDWWRHADQSGGQVVEQATHLFDLTRLLFGEGEVVGAASARHDRPEYPGFDVDAVSAAVVRFESGAIGSFTSTSIMPAGLVELELISDDLRQVLRLEATEAGQSWTLEVADRTGQAVEHSGRDAYEIEDEAFLDAIESGDASRVFSTYEDAMRTDALCRAVVAASGSRG
jgi:myo-inositol 2-dehydrogenase/D-chiro-inositol 1-dehydrogenase